MSITIKREDVNQMIDILSNAINEGVDGEADGGVGGVGVDGGNFIEYSKLLSNFMKQLLYCKNMSYANDISKLLTNTIMVLQNLYICAVGGVLEGSNISGLLEVERVYKGRLMDILKVKIKNSQSFVGSAIGKNPYSEFCIYVKKQLDLFFVDLNRDLDRFNLKSMQFSRECGYVDEDGEFIEYRTLIENISVKSNKVVNDYYTLYNGYIFYAYMGGIPITKTIIKFVQCVFYFTGALACSLSKSKMVSLFFRLRMIFSKRMEESEVKILKSQLENTTFVENLIAFICRTVDLYSRSYKKLEGCKFYVKDLENITRNLNNILDMRERVIKKYFTPDKTQLELFGEDMNKKLQSQVLGKIPVPESTKSIIKSKLDNPFYQSMLVSITSSTDKKGVREAKKIINYYNPILSKKEPSVLHKKLWEGDWASMFYSGDKRKAYILKPNSPMFMVGSVWILMNNYKSVTNFLDKNVYNEKDYNFIE